ncbi:MAG: hypothetical protein EHM91_02545, partial [Planctomycetota bacterium]
MTLATLLWRKDSRPGMRVRPSKLALLLSVLASCSPSPQVPEPAPYTPAGDTVQAFDDRPVPHRAEWFERVMKDPLQNIDLVEAATIIASHRLDTPRASSAIPRFLHPVLQKVRAKLRPSSTPDQMIDALNEHLLPALRRAAAGELRWLSETLGSEDGECAVNSLMYLIAGDAIGLRLEPVLVPSHALVCFSSGELRRNIETTDRGQHMTSEEVRMLLSRDPTSINLLPEIPEALEKALHPSTRRQFVAALLCRGAKERQKGEEDLELAARLAPDFHGPPTMLGGYWALRDNFARA